MKKKYITPETLVKVQVLTASLLDGTVIADINKDPDDAVDVEGAKGFDLWED